MTASAKLQHSVVYALVISSFVVFLTITSNYIRFNKKQTRYIEANPWVTDIAVFFAAFMSMELNDPTMHNMITKLLISLMITLIFKLVTYETADLEDAEN